jgi:hypothetical protein
MILTPVTLWKDFDDTLLFEEKVLSEQIENGVVTRELFFSGRQTNKGRVKIYAKYVFPEGAEEFPAVMILFEAGFPFDEKLYLRYVKSGYGVLCVDYCGARDEGYFTEYPQDIDYANYTRAGEKLKKAEPSAKETSWYEWAAVARYAVRYLSERKEVTRVGAIGLRTGGEILFKIAPYAPISCMISVCAAGWLAYRGVEKFADGKKVVFSEERHRFIAGIDSQSYAPYVKCPLLLISAINDRKYNYDRVYDTFEKINPQVEKALLFSAHGNGLIGSHSLHNVDLFLDKYLKGRSVFLSEPVSICVEEDENGKLVVRGKFDAHGEISEYGIFFTEKVTDSESRDWTRVLGRAEDLEDNVGTVPLNLYAGTKKALVYAFVNYSNNFSVTSKIQEVVVEKQYANACPASRVLYTSTDGRNGFSVFRNRARAIADCFVEGEDSKPNLLPGYGGIAGITSRADIVSYRVGEPRYEAPEGAAFSFDAYAKEKSSVKVSFYREEDDAVFTAEAKIEGGGKWKRVLMSPEDFMSETGAHLSDFKEVSSLSVSFDGEVLINNVIWI